MHTEGANAPEYPVVSHYVCRAKKLFNTSAALVPQFVGFSSINLGSINRVAVSVVSGNVTSVEWWVKTVEPYNARVPAMLRRVLTHSHEFVILKRFNFCLVETPFRLYVTGLVVCLFVRSFVTSSARDVSIPKLWRTTSTEVQRNRHKRLLRI